MSSSYSANQYDSAFSSQKLQNWCVSKQLKKRPNAVEGRTTFIANDRGHLLTGMTKKGSAWPEFKGTWDLPARLPACNINPTSRSTEGCRRLEAWGLDPQRTSSSQPHRGSKNTARLQAVDKQVNGDLLQDGTAQSSRPPSRHTPALTAAPPGTQNHALTEEQRPNSESQLSQAAEEGPVTQPIEEKPAPLAMEDARSVTHCSQVGGEHLGDRPATRPATAEERPVRPRPMSQVSGRSVASPHAPSCNQRQRSAQLDN